MAFNRQKIKQVLCSPVPFVAWLAITALVAISGPLGTYNTLSLQNRLLAWSVFIFFAIFAGIFLRFLVVYLMPNRGFWIVSVVTSAALASVLACPLLLFVEYFDTLPGQTVPTLFETFLTLFSIGLALSSLRVLLDPMSLPNEPVEAPNAPRLVRRLTPDVRGRVIRCAVSDHYVLVVTDKGEDRLLMRFTDAIAELEGVDGMRVHRSHWVAVDAVTGHANENGKMVLTAKDGAKIPVSRNYRSEVASRFSA